MPIQIVADLRFEVRDGERPRDEPVLGQVRADGGVVSVDFSRTPSLVGARTRRVSGAVAEFLHREGLSVKMSGPAGLVVTVGHGVDAPWWQRLLTGTRYARLGSARALASSLRGPRILTAALPGPVPRRADAPPVRRAATALGRRLRRPGPLDQRRRGLT